jgi:hypothetical protein
MSVLGESVAHGKVGVIALLALYWLFVGSMITCLVVF